MTYKEQFDFWLNDDYFDEGTKQELLAIRNDEKEIEDRFYRELEFGTGGLRGVIGAGTNRMNVYTVRKASQGLANYIIKNNACDKGVAIAYDSRRFSPEFADEAALCLAANGIKAYVFDALRPTPMLSFALRQLGCTAGIVVTASHNPPEYNGYKVYWEDGAQVTPPHDNNIIGEVNAITDYHTVKTMDKQEAIDKGLYIVIGKEIDDAYKNNRGRILQQQIDELKAIIIKKITGYKGIDEELIRRICNVSDTQVPPSSLKALKMDEYINKQKAIFIFSTNDKKSYKNDVETMFANTTKVQFDSYIAEITKVAQDKTAELIQEFKNNIDVISSNLELLIKDEKKASAEQAKAKAVLDLVVAKDIELNNKIWGEDKAEVRDEDFD